MYNMLKKVLKLYHPVRFCTSSASKHTLENLQNRTLVQVEGNEASDFLQGLITNDMQHLKDGPGSMFAMFLNTKGRVLYDAIIYRAQEQNGYLIECDKQIAAALEKHLKMYRVRRKIEITNLQDTYDVHALFKLRDMKELLDKNVNVIDDGFIVPCDKLNATLPKSSSTVYKDLMLFKDPRISSLGSRILSKKEINVREQLSDLVEIDQSSTKSYKWLRYAFGIGEGVEDLLSGTSFPLEANCDYLHGVSFHKGCYIGQELTARTHHTGVIRKRLMPLYFTKVPKEFPKDQIILHEKENLGKLRGVEGDVGLALLRINKALNFGEINVGDGVAKVIRPTWWPIEAAKERAAIKKL